MDRRALLGLLGASAAGLPGCTEGLIGGSGGTRTPTSSNGAPDPALAFGALQPAVVRLQTDRLDVYSSGGQYLYVRVRLPAAEAPDPDAFVLRFAGGEYTTVGEQNPPLYRNRIDQRYRAETGRGWILFEIPPTGDASETRVSGGGHEWHPSSAVRDRLSSAHPELTVSPRFSSTVESGTQPTLVLTIENDEPTPGRFVAGLSRTGPDVAQRPVARVSEPVDGESTTEVTVADDTEIESVGESERDDDEPDMTYQLVWRHDAVDADVSVVSEDTASGSG